MSEQEKSEHEKIEIPKSHPRYDSLMIREKVVEGFENGLVTTAGLIAQGRGEAYDYLLGERTAPQAEYAEKIAAAALVAARGAVISVNGNAAALCADEIIALSKSVPAKIEVNLFYRTEERLKRIINYMKEKGAADVLGDAPNARLPGIEHKRGLCSKDGIYNADAVLLMIEDGDRTQSLASMEKTVIAIDLNPLSRTAQTASISVIDNLQRALPNIDFWVKKFKREIDAYGEEARQKISAMLREFDNQKNLEGTLHLIADQLMAYYDHRTPAGKNTAGKNE